MGHCGYPRRLKVAKKFPRGFSKRGLKRVRKECPKDRAGAGPEIPLTQNVCPEHQWMHVLDTNPSEM